MFERQGPSGPSEREARDPVIYDGLRVVDLHRRDRGRVLRQAADRPRRRRRVRRADRAIRCSRTSARRSGTRPTSTPWLAARRHRDRRRARSRARRRRSARDGVDHAGRPRRARRRARPHRRGAAGAQRAACRATATRTAPPLTVGGRLGEYVTGAYAALGAATAWRRASRTGVARDRRRVDARSDPDDVHDRADADGALSRRPA